jgi:hypothetical protein
MAEAGFLRERSGVRVRLRPAASCAGYPVRSGISARDRVLLLLQWRPRAGGSGFGSLLLLLPGKMRRRDFGNREPNHCG